MATVTATNQEQATENILSGGTNRLHELVVYLCRAFEGDDAFSLLRLSRLLFSCDLAVFRRRGVSLTGQQYVKRADGGAEPQNLTATLLHMQTKGELAFASRNPLDVWERKPIALREADISVFTTDLPSIDVEIAAERVGSGQSAEQVAWLLAPVPDGEEIPLGIVLVEQRELSEAEKAFADELDLSDLSTLI